MRFLLVENRDGNGWLIDRECVGRRGGGEKSESDELDPAWSGVLPREERPGTNKPGRLDGISRTEP